MNRISFPVSPVLLLRGILLSALLLGCSDDGSSPAGPDSGNAAGGDVRDLWISGFYYMFPHGAPAGAPEGAVVYVRDGSANGNPVTNLVAFANSERLSYDPAWNAYTGVAPGIEPGDTVKIAVGDGRASVSASAVAPGAPSGLFLYRPDALWVTSPATAGNTLVWDNPALRGGSIEVFLYEQVETGRYLVHWLSTDASESTRVTVYNHEVAYIASASEITALVCHSNGSFFPMNPAGSGLEVLSGVWGTWATAGASP
ncbi:MAG: hypothetical protein ABIK65_04335 [Candidatus Eisenbacteria bacterium]